MRKTFLKSHPWPFFILASLLCFCPSLWSQNPFAPTQGFQVFVRQDLKVNGGEVEGNLATGENFLVNGNALLASQQAGNFLVGGLPIGLLVGQQVRFQGGSLVEVKSNAYVKTGDCSGIKVWYQSGGLATQLLRINNGGNYATTPAIQLSASSSSLGVSETQNPVCINNLLDFSSAFQSMLAQSTAIAACQNNSFLYHPNGSPISDYNNLPNQVVVKLTQPVNIITLPGQAMNNIKQLKFEGDLPGPNRILVFNVEARGSFRFEGVKNSDFIPQHAPYVLYNFYNVNELEISTTRDLLGSVFAPQAAVVKSSSNALMGQLVAQSFELSAGKMVWAPFQGALNGCGVCIPPFVAPITGNSSLCLGTPLQLSCVTTGGTWTSSDTSLATVDASGWVEGKRAGDVVISYTISNSCGASVQRFNLKLMQPSSAPQITSNGALALCVGDTAVLVSSVALGNQWYLNGLALEGLVTQQFRTTTAGQYAVAINGTEGCSPLSLPVAVTEKPALEKPSLIKSGGNNLCPGSAVQLVSSFAGENKWYRNNLLLPNAPNPVLDATIAGVYAVEAVAAGFCASGKSDTVQLVALAAPPQPSISGNEQICLGAAVQWTATVPNGRWTSSNTAIATVGPNGLVTGISAGAANISYVVTGANGCENFPPVFKTVQVSEGPSDPYIEMGGPTIFCQGDSVVLMATTADADIIAYQWVRADDPYGNFIPVPGATLSQYVAKQNGYYSVVVTNRGGCTRRSSTVINVGVSGGTVTPAIVPDGNTNICGEGQVTLASSLTASQYLWFKDGLVLSNSNKKNILVKPDGYGPGTYVLRTVDALGCISDPSAPVPVIANPKPPRPVVTPAGNLSLCNNQTLNLESSAADTYQWYLNNAVISGATNKTLLVSQAGAYKVFTKKDGCLAEGPSNEVQVSTGGVAEVPVITNTGAAVLCTGDQTTLTSNLPTGNQWFRNGVAIPGAVQQQLTVNSSGDYTVQNTGNNSCTSAVSLPVSIVVNGLPGIPQISTSGPTNFCQGQTVTFTLVPASDGIAITAYQWYFRNTANDAWTLIPGAQSATYTTGSAGQYTGTVFAAAGCSRASDTHWEVRVSAAPAKPSVTASGPTTFCTSETLELTSSAGSVTRWLRNGNFVASGPLYRPVASGTFAAQVVENGCTVNSDPVAVTLNSAPNPPVITANGSTSFCAPGSVQLTSSGTSAGHQWYLDGVIIPGANNPSFVASTSGAYTVTNANSLCASKPSDPVVVAANAAAALPRIFVVGNSSVCDGQQVRLLSNSLVGNQWNLNGVPIGGATSIQYLASVSGTYTLSVNNPANCQQGTSSGVVVTVSALPIVPPIQGGDQVCQNSNLVLTNAQAGGTWSSADNSIAVVNATGTVTGIGAGNVNILYTVTGAGGCVNVVQKQITVNPLPAALTIVGNSNLCVGSSTSFQSSQAGGLWSSSNAAVATVGANTGLVSALNAGITNVVYTLTNAQGCSQTTQKALVVLASPVVAPITGPNEVCEKQTIQLASTTPGGRWSVNDNTKALINGNGQLTGIAAGSVNVLYQVVGSNGCRSNAPGTLLVTVKALPEIPQVVANGPTSFCVGSSVQFKASSVTAGVSYQWEKSNDPYTGFVAIVGATSDMYTATTAGYYRVVSSLPGACSRPSSTVWEVKVGAFPDKPTVTANGPTVFCTNGMDQGFVTLSASNGQSYQWFKNGVAMNQQNPTILVLSTGAYAVKTTNEFGCTSDLSDPVQVVANPYPPQPQVRVVGSPTVCAGNTATLQSDTAFQYQWFKNESPLPGTQTNVLQVTSSGLYKVQLVDRAGCTSPLSKPTPIFVLPVPPRPVVSVSGPTQFCAGDSTRLMSSANGGNQWYLNGSPIVGATQNFLVVKQAGAYAVGVQSVLGCNSLLAAPVNIVVQALTPQPILLPAQPAPICSGDSLQLSFSGTGTAEWYRNGLLIPGVLGNQFWAKDAGAYVVRNHQVGSCPSLPSTAVQVRVNEKPVLAPIQGPNQICLGSQDRLYHPYPTGTWSSSNPAVLLIDPSTGQISARAVGQSLVRYRVVSPNGCSAEVTTTVLVLATPAKPRVQVLGANPICLGNNTLLSSSSTLGNQWYRNDSLLVGATDQLLFVSLPGSYAVKTTNLLGCVSTEASNPVVVIVQTPPTKPAVVPASSTRFCVGGTVVLNSSASSGNQWYKDGNPIVGATATSLLVNAKGFYSVQVSNGSGCLSLMSDATWVETFPLPEKPMVLPNLPPQICAGQSLQLNSNNLVGNQWFRNNALLPNANANSLVVSSSGDYRVQVTSILGCVSPLSDPVSVVVSPLPILSDIVGNPVLCQSDTTRFSHAQPGGEWRSADASVATVDRNGLVKGIKAGSTLVYYQFTNANGCSAQVSKTITVFALPDQPGINLSGDPRFCAGDSILLTSLVGGSVQWYRNGSPIPNANTGTLVVKTGGSYAVDQRNALGCKSLVSPAVVVTVLATPPAPVVSPAGPLSFCTGNQQQLTTNSSLVHQWLLNNVPIDGEAFSVLNANQTGLYTARVMNSLGCWSNTSNAVQLTEVPLVSMDPINGPGAVCAGNNAVYAHGLPGGAWASSDPTVATINAAGQLSALNAGFTWISYQVQNALGCPSITRLLVKVKTTPDAPEIRANGSTILCDGETVVLTSSASLGNQWLRNGVNLPGATGQFFRVSASGNYQVVVNGGNACVLNAASNVLSVQINPRPVLGPISVASPICAGTTTVATNASSGGTWRSSQPNVFEVDQQGRVQARFPGSANLFYELRSAAGCSSTVSQTLSVLATPDPPRIVANGGLVFCAGSAVKLTAFGGTSFQWYRDGVPIPNANQNEWVATVSGRYQVLSLGSNGCASPLSKLVEVVVLPLPTAPVLRVVGLADLCVGQTATLSSSAASDNQWFRNGNRIDSISGNLLTTNQAGTYAVRVVAANGCSSNLSNSQALSFASLPPTAVIQPVLSNTICTGEVNLLTTQTPAARYQWFLNQSPIPGATAAAVNAVQSGSYSVVTQSATGCLGAPSSSVQVQALPVSSRPVIVPQSATAFCANDSVVLTSSVAASRYEWWINGVLSPNLNARSISLQQSALVSLRIQDSGKCISLYATSVETKRLPQPPAPGLTVVGSANICLGDSTQLQALSGFGYQWFRNDVLLLGQNKQNLVVKDPGAYAVVLRSAEGCSGSPSPKTNVSVFNRPLAPVVTAQGPTRFCEGGAVGLQTLPQPGSGYQWYRNGLLLPNATNRTYLAEQSGQYHLQLVSNIGCASPNSNFIPVEVQAKPIGNILGPSQRFLCPGSNILLSAKGGIRYQWYFNGQPIAGGTNGDLTISQAGLYRADAFGEGGCMSPISKTISVQAMIKPISQFVFDGYCTLNWVNFNSTSQINNVGPVFYQWTNQTGNIVFNGSSPSYQVLNPGTYPVKLKVTPFFCENLADSSIQVIAFEAARPPIRMPAENLVLNEVANLQARSFGTQYRWTPTRFLNNPNVSNPSIRPGAEQDYQIQITNAAGCVTTDSLLVRVFNQPDIFVPTVFTPNGDGLNDRLFLNYVAIKELKMFKIYNRWGKLMFETKNMSESWDGRLYGEMQPMDTYTWFIELVDKNGQFIRKQGSITLMK